MGHFEINNLTPFAFEPLFVCDETGRPVVAALTKATFDIVPGAGLELSTEQLPVDVQGSFHGDPGASSPRYEPETAFAKPGTDVVLIGHAHAPSTRSRWVDVELRVGRVARRLRVWGDRRWVRRLFGVRATAPERFEKIPLVYERAYGGWDRSSDDPERHSVFPANPVGVGYRAKRARFVAGALLPNIEDPKQLLTKYRGRSVAAGFGFVAPHWEPRRSLAGSYDEAWSRERMPLLPLDFRREFFNAAAPGLVATPHLRGDEVVRVMGASPEGRVEFALPALDPPLCRVALRDRDDAELATALDTVVVDLDARRLVLLWRAHHPLRSGPLDVAAIEVRANADHLRRAAAPGGSNVVPLHAPQAA